MLPEQRGLLASWFNRFRTSRRARRKGRGRLQGFTRLAQVESLEDRRLLTNTVFVDFGTRLNTVTMPEDTVGNAGGWDTWGYVPPNNGVNWVFGPEFNVAGNPNITYTPLRTLFANKGVSFNLSQMQTDFPWEYQTGTQTPLSQLDLLEGSIMNMLTQMFLPFNITVEEVTSTHFGSVNVTGAVNDPADFLGENNPLYDPNTYDPTAMPPTINRGPLFNPMQTNPTTMAPDQYQDVYILVGGFTIGGTQIGNSASDPANPGILGVFGATSYDIDSDTLQLSTNPAQRFVDPMYMDPSDPSGNGLLRYSDGGVAVNADTIFDHWLAQQANPAVTPINLNVTIAQVAAQGAAETWGLSTTSDGQPKPWNSFFDTNIDMLNSSDVMRQGPYTGNEYPTDFNMPFFENFYTMVGSLNEDPTDVQNAYEQFVNDPDIGPSVYAYITGTGAYDKIDITADAADPTMADVTISPYSDASFADSSFISSFAYDAANPTGYMTSAASPYSYTVDLSSGILLIDAGNNADQISIDPAIFNNLFEVFVFGGEGLTNGQVDNLSMAGDGTQSVAVAPSNMNLQTYNFAISYETDMEIVGPTSVTLLVASEFEDNSTIHLENFNSLTYTMPEFMGDDFTITGQNGSNLVLPPSVGETDMVIDGTAGPTTLSPIPVGVSNVEFTNIGTVTVQDPLGATDDSVAIDSTAGYADGLQNLAIILGPGNDSLTINGPIDLTPGVMGGTLTYDGGPGTNTLTVSDDTNWALTDSSLTDGLGNTIQFIGGVSIADITGGIDPHTFSVENWSGDAFLTALAGGDTFNIGDTAPVVGNVSIDASGFVGDLFNVKSFTGTGNFDFTGSFGANVFNVNTTDITLSLPAIGSGSASGYAGSAVNLATTSGSKTAKLNSTAGLFVGEAVVGPDIATGTTIAAIVNTTTITLSTVATGSGVNATLIGTIGANIVPVTYTTTSGSTDVTVSTVAGISVGQSIVGTNIPTGTTISGISNMTFVGGDGGNTFNITAWNGNGSITGGAGNDNFYIAAWTGTGPLIGGAGDDDFVFGTLSIISPSGNGNIDAITDPHTIIGGNGNDTLTLDDSGTNGAKNYTIGATSVSDSSTFGGVNFDSTLDNIVVIGSQGANTFLVTPNSKAAITIDGQLPTTIPGDTLNVDLTGTKGAKLTPNGPFGGTLTFTSGQRPITYSNIETTVPDLTQVAQQQQQSQQQQQMNTLLGELENDPLLVEAADPGTASAPLVKLYDVKTNTVLFSFDAYETTFKGGVRAEIVPDVTGDGVPDIVVAPGSGRLGEVKLYSGAMLAAGAATTGTHLVANPDTALISVSGLIPVTTVNGSAIATIGVVGQSVSGSTIAAGTTVSSMTNSTTVALSLPATGSATITAVLGPAVVTLKTTKGKTAATISNVLSVDGLIVGQSVAGSNSVIVTTTSGSKMVNVSSVAGLTVGEPVTGLNIPGNTTISAIGVGTITLSAAATGSGTVIADFDPVASNSIISALGSSVGGITIKLSANIKSTGSNNIFAAGFMPEAATYKSGLYVAAGDLTGSGDIDIVTSRSSTVPNVEVFEVNNLLLGDDIPDVAFNPYTTKFLTGAQIAVGDVDGNGVDQIVTAPGTGQSVQIKVFDYNTVLDDFDNNLAVTPERTFLGFESTFKNSVSLALGDADGDGTDEIMLGAGSGGTSRVRVLDGYGDLLEQFQAFTAGNTSAALRIAAVDVNGEAELFVGQGIVSKTHVIEGFDPLTGKLIDTFMETDPAMTDGIFLG